MGARNLPAASLDGILGHPSAGSAIRGRPVRADLLCGLQAALLLAGWTGNAEAQAPRPMRLDRISLEQGLSQNTVTCMLQDPTGFLWLGTQDGLNRYDGYEFKVYRNDAADPASLPHDWILSLALDPSGDLWIGTEGGGFARWRRAADAFDTYRLRLGDPRSLSGDRVSVITRDPRGSLWLGTFEAGLHRFDPETETFQHFRNDPDDDASLVDDRLRALYVDRRGDLWIGTMGGLDLMQRDGGFRHFRHDLKDRGSLSDDRVRAILEDGEGNLWVGTFAGLNRFDPATGSFVRYQYELSDATGLSHNRVRSLFEDQDGRLWIGTDGGLNLRRPESGDFVHYRHDPANGHSLGSDSVISIYQDRSGLMFFSTAGAGVSRWNPATWDLAHFREDGFGDGRSNNVLAISEDRQGGVWLGTFGGGLERFDRATGERIHYIHDPGDGRSLADDRVTALLHDQQGTLWVGTVDGGLNRFDAETGTFERFSHDPARQESLSVDAVVSIYQDRRGRLWIGTYDGGLDRYRGDGTFQHYRHDVSDPLSLSNDRVVSLVEEEAGNLWVATDGGGLNYFRPEDGSFLRLQNDPDDPDSLSSNELIVVHMDPEQRLWIGTKGSGLDLLREFEGDAATAVFENYSKSSGLPSGIVWGIETDDEGCLWISTSAGLTRFDPEARTFESYKAGDGLQSDEFNMGAHYKSPGGELFFGGVNGFNVFTPDRIRENHSVPPIVLTSFSKRGKTVRFDRPIVDVDRIDLSYEDYFVSFEFAALDFTAPAKNRYRYRLEGFQKDWVDLGNRRRVDFTNLDPGRYVLRVQGSNSDGVWNEDGLTIDLTVRPPWWKTWWFQMVALVAATSAVLAAYRLRVRSIRKNNEQLRRLVDERTRELERAQEQLLRRERLAALGEVAGSVAHEIRNPLGAMKNSLYMLRHSLQPANRDAEDDLALIERQIRQADHIIAELLDFARDRPAERERFLLAAVVEKVLTEGQVPENVRIVTGFETDPLTVEADLCQIEQILNNLLSNAVEAMPSGGELVVTCRRRGGDAVVSFVDAGIGIAPEEISKIFEPLYTSKPRGIGLGLALSERYARLNQGRIECESELGKGAAFRLVLPLG